MEAIEQGDFKNFKDIFVLKVIVGDYAKYLGLDSNKIIDEFNDYVFESTSKIPIDEIKKALGQQLAQFRNNLRMSRIEDFLYSNNK